nr:transcriptional regulator, ArsR family [uncultured bacterium]
MFSNKANSIFQDVIASYKVLNSVDQPFENKYDKDQDLIAHLLFRKCWIDTVQWAYEDIIRDPNIDPVGALKLKRMIDASNQDRTDTVEFIDSYFLTVYKDTKVIPGAKINSESPAWALDRLSILALKIYHMQLETVREDASESHQQNCLTKLNTLLEQRTDLSSAIDDLLEDISSGNKYMKVYKQMKMYNDDELNPVLRGTK